MPCGYEESLLGAGRRIIMPFDANQQVGRMVTSDLESACVSLRHGVLYVGEAILKLEAANLLGADCPNPTSTIPAVMRAPRWERC